MTSNRSLPYLLPFIITCPVGFPRDPAGDQELLWHKVLYTKAVKYNSNSKYLQSGIDKGGTKEITSLAPFSCTSISN